MSIKYKDTGVGVLKQGQMAGLVGLVSLENHKVGYIPTCICVYIYSIYFL